MGRPARQEGVAETGRLVRRPLHKAEAGLLAAVTETRRRSRRPLHKAGGAAQQAAVSETGQAAVALSVWAAKHAAVADMVRLSRRPLQKEGGRQSSPLMSAIRA